MYLEPPCPYMATSDDDGTSSRRVQTYVPDHQHGEWQAHADDLDMSLSEFVRCMVQAGRRDFAVPGDELDIDASEEASGGADSEPDPQGEPLEDRVAAILSSGEHYDWEEIRAEVVGDLEERLDEALQSLQERGEVRYSGRHGGYTLA